MTCFQGLLFSPDAASLLLHNFCIYHIDAPGHEVSVAVGSLTLAEFNCLILFVYGFIISSFFPLLNDANKVSLHPLFKSSFSWELMSFLLMFHYLVLMT
jgi:hypothetical protein